MSRILKFSRFNYHIQCYYPTLILKTWKKVTHTPKKFVGVPGAPRKSRFTEPVYWTIDKRLCDCTSIEEFNWVLYIILMNLFVRVYGKFPKHWFEMEVFLRLHDFDEELRRYRMNADLGYKLLSMPYARCTSAKALFQD